MAKQKTTSENKCLYDGKPLQSIEGRKAKQFCNGNCRNKYYYKKKTEGRTPKRLGRPPKAKPGIAVQDLTKPAHIATPITDPPKTTNTTQRHHLWQVGDPKENTPAFYMRYEVMSYDELEHKQKTEN